MKVNASGRNVLGWQASEKELMRGCERRDWWTVAGEEGKTWLAAVIC